MYPFLLGIYIISIGVRLRITVGRVVPRAPTTITGTRLLFLRQFNEILGILCASPLVSDCPRHASERLLTMFAPPAKFLFGLFWSCVLALIRKVTLLSALETLVVVAANFSL